MAMRVKHEGECCVDCLHYLANGDQPTDRDAWGARVNARWTADELRHASAACEENCDGSFSWKPCGFCGSPLGGDRHSFVILEPVADAAAKPGS